MSKSVLISIRPQWCAKIANGKKTIEVRKTHLKLQTPFKCYIYETHGKTDMARMDEDGHFDFRGRGKVIGEFVCDSVTNLFADSRFWLDEKAVEQTCLTGNQIREYANGREALYGWHISSLQIYDKPKELSEFCKPIMPTGLRYEDDAIKRPPQSWAYVEEYDEKR